MVDPTPLTLHRVYGCYCVDFLFPSFIFSQVHHHHQWQTQNPPLSTPPTTTKQNKTKQNKNLIISYAHKKKNFPIINTTTNYINPPPSQPKLQTITTNIENPNTPTKNIQIGDPKLPTQTHKHTHKKKNPKPKPKPNPRILRSKTKIMKMRSGFLFLVYIYVWMNWWVGLKKKERKKKKKRKKDKASVEDQNFTRKLIPWKVRKDHRS